MKEKREVGFVDEDEMGDHVPMADKLTQSYTNPFERADAFMKKITTDAKSGREVEIQGAMDAEAMTYTKRKWKVDIDKEVLSRIESGRDQYDKWLKLVNNSSNKKVWEVYDHLAADLTHEVLSELMGTIDKDLDAFCEKVIVDEF